MNNLLWTQGSFWLLCVSLCAVVACGVNSSDGSSGDADVGDADVGDVGNADVGDQNNDVLDCEPACSDGAQCVEGVCVADDACSPTCRADEICRDGACEPEDPNACDPVCVEGQDCIDGVCTDSPECMEDSDCTGADVCQDGLCVVPDPLDCDPACTEDEECVEGVCVVVPECADDSGCAEEQVCLEGVCVDQVMPDCTPACAEDEECVDGVCVMTPDCTEDSQCLENQVCTDGVCVEQVMPECDPACAEGEACVDGICVVVPECIDDSGCAEGQVCMDGFCMIQNPPECDPACAESEECIDGVCVVVPECVDDSGCAEDQECVEGLCEDVEVPICDPPCEEGVQCVDGVCVDADRCGERSACGPEQVCINDECVFVAVDVCEAVGQRCSGLEADQGTFLCVVVDAQWPDVRTCQVSCWEEDRCNQEESCVYRSREDGQVRVCAESNCEGPTDEESCSLPAFEDARCVRSFFEDDLFRCLPDGEGQQGEACLDDASCAQDLFCVFGRCLTACTVDGGECGGEVCQLLDDDGGGFCLGLSCNPGCSLGEVCDRGQCVQAEGLVCDGVRDMETCLTLPPAGGNCVEGSNGEFRCRPVGGGLEGDRCVDASSCVLGLGCYDSVCRRGCDPADEDACVEDESCVFGDDEESFCLGPQDCPRGCTLGSVCEEGECVLTQSEVPCDGSLDTATCSESLGQPANCVMQAEDEFACFAEGFVPRGSFCNDTRQCQAGLGCFGEVCLEICSPFVSCGWNTECIIDVTGNFDGVCQDEGCRGCTFDEFCLDGRCLPQNPNLCTSEFQLCAGPLDSNGVLACVQGANNLEPDVWSCRVRCEMPEECLPTESCFGFEQGDTSINACVQSNCDSPVESLEQCAGVGPNGGTCIPYSDEFLFCLEAGTLPEGAACEESEVSTPCLPGLLCVEQVCTPFCSLTQEEACGQGRSCRELVATGEFGVCVDACPGFLSTDECGPDRGCLPTGPEEGFCSDAGEVEVGEACLPGQCTQFNACVTVEETPECAPLCDRSSGFGDESCQSGEACLEISEALGVCVPGRCTPFVEDSGCQEPGEETCVPVEDVTRGLCVGSGAAAPGEVCELVDGGVFGGCEPGLVCDPNQDGPLDEQGNALTGLCASMCRTFSSEDVLGNGCEEGQICNPYNGVWGACEDREGPELEPFDACPAGQQWCGDETLCVQVDQQGNRLCIELCRLGSDDDCTEGQCDDLLNNAELGLCVP